MTPKCGCHDCRPACAASRSPTFATITRRRSTPARQTIVLVGPNGAGKTNLIEAISFLAPGRGLRRATLDEVAFSEGDGSWAVAAEIEGALGLATLGTGIERPLGEGAAIKRKYRIDREPVASAAAFADHLRVVWLVPAMDALFAGAPSERRRFLDRLALAVDAEHGSRVNALERSLRSRNRLLEEPRPDPHWLDAVEHETAELAVAVAGLRVETVHRLERGAGEPQAVGLSAGRDRARRLDGKAHPGASGERNRGALPRGAARQSRRDAAAGRTLDGPHLTDLKVTYAPKGIAAADASTGEQKALLIGLVLAHARLIAEMTGFRAGPAARRSRRASRSGAARCAARRTCATWRAGLDDRRRSGAVCRDRGDAAMVSKSRPGRLERRRQ